MTTTIGASQAPWSFAAPWGATGYVSDLDGPVHWIEFKNNQKAQSQQAQGQQAQATPIVFVHGLGGSHLNWSLIGQSLAAGRRAVALDLHGFGLTAGDRATATVQANARLLDRFVREITGTPVILVGNSMGGLISIMQTAAAPDTVRGLVLIDPALPLAPARPDPQVAGQFLLQALPGLGGRYVRAMQSQPPQVAVHRLIELCFADPSRADPDMLTASIALASQRQEIPNRPEAFLAASRSLLRVLARRRRFWAMTTGISVPVLLIAGDADRLVSIAATRQAAARNPRWDTVVLAGVGHTPQLEVSGQVAGIISDWLARNFTAG